MQWLTGGLRGKSEQKKQSSCRELRIATSGSHSVRSNVEVLRVDGAGSFSQNGRVRAAVFVPTTSTTIQFHAEQQKKSAPCSGRASSVHALQMFSPEDTKTLLDDAKRIGSSIGWVDRGVSLPTQDVLVQNLTKESQDLVHRAIRERLLPFARRQYPHLTAAFDKQPYPRPGNLFIVRYSAASQRPGGRGLKLHKDETALTFNLCLSHEEEFTGGGTYFPAASSDVDGILIRPKGGYCLVHDGNIKHAGNEVRSGDRFILVGFYNADGRDRAGEDEFFGPAAREAQLRAQLPQPVQTIYFTTAVASQRGGGGPGEGGAAEANGEGAYRADAEYADPPPPARGSVGCGGCGAAAAVLGLSAVAIQGPVSPKEAGAPGASSSAGAAAAPGGGGPPGGANAGACGGGGRDEPPLSDTYWRSHSPPHKSQTRGSAPATCMPTWMVVLQGRWRPATALAK